MHHLKERVSVWIALLFLALSACDVFIPVPMPAPSSIPAFHPTATLTATPQPTSTPRATSTPSPTPYFTPTPPPCDKATLVNEEISPPVFTIAPGTPFTQTWRLRNDSPCTWTPAYWLVKAGGNDLGGPRSMRIPYLVFSGQEFDISVELVAPCRPGIYYSYWLLQDDEGIYFGVGSRSNVALLAHIITAGTPVKPTCAGRYFVR